MTERQKRIVKAILEALNALDGGQHVESVLHGETCLKVTPNPTLAEFNDALGVADRSGWVTGVPGKFTQKKKWSLSDACLAAWLEMQRE